MNNFSHSVRLLIATIWRQSSTSATKILGLCRVIWFTRILDS